MASAGRILIMPKGDYDANSTYDNLDLVNHNGMSWLAKKTAKGIEPTEENTEHWQKMCEINIANNLVTETEGYALDARQGKVLDEKITDVNNNLGSKPFVATIQVDKATNYDTTTTAGTYFYNSWAGDVSLGNNQPETTGSIGSMIVTAHGVNRDQIVISQLGIYYRRYNGTEWNEWKNLKW